MVELLQSYGLRPKRIRLIAQRDNDVYRVDTRDASYALRHHRSGVTPEEVGRELSWLRHLSPQLGTLVPSPVGDPTENEGRTVSVLTWVHGRFPKKPTRRLALEMGRSLAEIHQAGEDFTPPKGSRQWDEGEVFSGDWSAKLAPLKPLMAQEDWSMLLDHGSAITEAFQSLPKNGERGMLHADFYGLNCVFQSGRVGVIDFANCGVGPLAYDVAVGLRHFIPEWRPALLRGYRSVRPVPNEEALPALIQARMISGTLYAAERVMRPGGTYNVQKVVDWSLKSLRESPAL